MEFKKLPQSLEEILVLIKESNEPLTAELMAYDLSKIYQKNISWIYTARALSELLKMEYVQREELFPSESAGTGVSNSDKFSLSFLGTQYFIDLQEYNRKINHDTDTLAIAKESNKIAKQANFIAWGAIILSVVAIVVNFLKP